MKFIVFFLIAIAFQGCSGIYFIVGSTAQKFNDLAEYGFHKPSVEEIESECNQHIFRDVIVSFPESTQSITIKELNTSIKIETALAKNYDNSFVVRRLEGNTTYSITTDTNQSYLLSELIGHFNPRCHMFGCEPVCSIEEYKINGQNSNIILLREGLGKVWSK
ncbi:MAG: hypothetical protein PHQ90_11550 [Sulfuricurvum sp.]|uniref:hypothetical protein n=1 Tax=Sulfuricurvum sp. TaxID=2025608 RepID=UPI0026362879|nr:hypothetical protein [Sulfuricurvum sp.]MDD2369930.1 hypothetical protein [Sulfuricurvum sp.]MDD5118933.1 hypothetical protein [Sulfuricurvum sp.]